MEALTAQKLAKAQEANRVKLKLKTLCKQIDAELSGEIKAEVFFQLLELHGVKLSKPDLAQLKLKFSRNG